METLSLVSFTPVLAENLEERMIVKCEIEPFRG